MEQEQHGEVMHGFTDNYIKVTMPFNTEAVNNLVEVQLSTIDTEGNVIALQLEESN
jgi:threonylcarbamoyladenosine tRNA methylthiotransferase MtaB